MILNCFNVKINIILIHFQVKNTYHNPYTPIKKNSLKLLYRAKFTIIQLFIFISITFYILMFNITLRIISLYYSMSRVFINSQ